MTAPATTQQTYDRIIENAHELFEDLSFQYVRAWKARHPDRRVIGFLPIYIPREILHALDILPVGLFGAGDRLPVVRGDAYFQSYICHLPRTLMEMALSDCLEAFDGYIFPSICDVIRNLSGVFAVTFPDKYSRYLDFPQNFDPEVGGTYYRRELERLAEELGNLNGRRLTTEALNAAIALYNENRRLLRRLDELRVEQPHKLSAVDFYLVRRAGQVLSVEDHNRMLEELLQAAPERDRLLEDKIRVVVVGSFCEQPPLGLIKTIENAGCYIVDDDFQLGLSWFDRDIPAHTDDPLGALVTAYLENVSASAAVFEDKHYRGDLLAERVKTRRADGVIFCAPSFCDPALLDRPMLEQAMTRHHIRHTSFQYHENLGQFHVIKEQAGTFADTIKLWE